MLITITTLLPWAFGYLFLGWLANLSKATPLHRASSIGLGYFIGVFSMYALFSSATQWLSLQAALWTSLAALMLGTCLLATVLYINRNRWEPLSTDRDNPVRAPWWLWLLVLLGGVHLICAAIEILHRPIFPWDGWFNWMYRAKAWYLSGSITAMDPVAQWASGATTQRYAVDGQHYPTLVPLTAVWAAVAMGQWSETLVNLPTLVCGIALPVALYGLCRDSRFSVSLAVITAYLATSTPLLGAHLSLAGQSDIWMAAFGGLGFTSLLCGLITRRHLLTALGLALVAMGTQIKLEGGVWLLAAFALAALALRPRSTAAAVAVLAITVGVALSQGIYRVEAPLLGILGVDNGRVYVPFFGSYALQNYELSNAYLTNFFLSGSWHLLWYALVATIATAAFRARRRESAIALALLVTATASQVLIFFFTEQGAWAEDWTAINRLPLHFLPVLVFTIALILGPAARSKTDASSTTTARLPARSAPVYTAALAVVSFLIASAVLLAGLASSLERENGPGIARDGKSLTTVVGAARAQNRGLALTGFDNNVAVVSTGPINVRAADASIVRIVARGSNRQEATLFWRRAASGELHSVRLAGLSDVYVALHANAAWQGVISELGLVLYDDGGSILIESLALQPQSLSNLVRKVARDWTATAPWSLKSMNWLPAGSADATVPLPLFLMGWLAVAIVLLPLMKNAPNKYTSILAIALLAWLLMDLRWIASRIELAIDTTETYSLTNARALAFGDDRITRLAVSRATADMTRTEGTEPARLIITSNNNTNMRFQLFRAKYHALPVPAYVHIGPLNRLPLKIGQHILVLKLRYALEGSAKAISSSAMIASLERRSDDEPRLVWEDDNAFMLCLCEPQP